MHLRIPALLLLASFCACAAAQTTPAPASVSSTPASEPTAKSYRSEIETLVRGLTDGEWAAGVVVGVAHGGTTEVYGLGRARDGSDQPPDADTLFEIGSVTKVFTSVILAEEERRGMVRLDEPVKDLLPQGMVVPERDGRPITLQHLATHSSGLPRMPDNFAPKDPMNPFVDYGPAQLQAFLGTCSLARAPGEKFDYSNFGAGLLGYALSLRAKQSYQTLVRDWIARPLGMASTTFDLAEKDRARFATGHTEDGEATPAWDFDVLASAGGIRSTATDMLRFLQANLGQLRSPMDEALRRTHEPRFDIASDAKIALGWHTGLKNTILWHNGQTGGFHSYVAFDQARGVGVVVLANSSTGVIDKLGVALMLMLRGEPYDFKLKGVAKVNQEVLDRYVGEYQVSPQFSISLKRIDDHLTAQATSQGRLRLYPESETSFLFRAVDARLSFDLTEGRVTGLVLHQNGNDVPATKVK